MTPPGNEFDPRTGRVIVIVVVASFAGIYALAAMGRSGSVPAAIGAVVLTVAAIGSYLGQVLPALKRFQGRWLLMVQLVLAALAVLPFGMSVALFGFPAAALLRRRALPGAVAVGAGAVLISAIRAGPGYATFDVTITTILIALIIYGLTTLADRAGEIHAARFAVAMSAAAEERLRIAAELNEGLGEDLAAITRQRLDRPGAIEELLRVTRRSLATARGAAAEFRNLSLAPEAVAARALLSAAGIKAEVRIGHTEPLGPAGALLARVLRAAVTDVVRRGTARRCDVETAERDGLLVLRVTNDGVAAAEGGLAGSDELAAAVEAVGGRLTAELQPEGRFMVEAAVAGTPQPGTTPVAYRQSLILLSVVLAGFGVRALLQVPAHTLPAAVACLAAICFLQLRWAHNPSAGRPRGWAWALIAQALLSYLPLLWFGKAWGGLAGSLAGSLLVALPAVVSWPLVGALMVSMGALAWSFSQSIPVIINSTVSGLVTGLIVYGLVRLAQLVDELQAAGDRLARAAVVQERLRTARDLHDLLGHSLAAILLKCELARRLVNTDPLRAQAELDDVVGIAERARADMHAVTGGEVEMSLRAELESARSVLTAAGVEVGLEPVSHVLPGPVDTVLSVVLREAVTNVLRHSTARHCRIAVSHAPGCVRLTVDNDGVHAADRPAGAGLGNLITRLAALGGTLRIRSGEDGWFQLRAELAVGDQYSDPDQVRTHEEVMGGR